MGIVSYNIFLPDNIKQAVSEISKRNVYASGAPPMEKKLYIILKMSYNVI